MATTAIPVTATIRGVEDWKLVSLPRFPIYFGFVCVRLIGETGRKSLERTL